MSWPPEEGSTKEAPAFPASPGCPPRDDHWKSERVPTEREQKTCQLTSKKPQFRNFQELQVLLHLLLVVDAAL